VASRPSGHGRWVAQAAAARAAGIAAVAQIWRVASVGAMWRAYAMPVYAPAVYAAAGPVGPRGANTGYRAIRGRFVASPSHRTCL